MSRYMTMAELADLLRVSTRTIQRKMRAGTLQEGVHYVRGFDLPPRFIREAVEREFEGVSPEVRRRAVNPSELRG